MIEYLLTIKNKTKYSQPQKSIIACASPTYGDFIPKAQDLFPLLWNFSSKGANSCNVLKLVDNFGS